MKKLCFLACICLLCALPAQAQKKKKNLPIEATVEVPNCIWIDTLGLFADQTEVGNIHWLEFMAFYETVENATYLPEEYIDLDSFRNQVLLPDTSVWRNLGDDIKSHEENYLRYPGFRYYPLVGITKQQAEAFCAWRSMVVTQNYNEAGKGLAKKYHVEITFRLPTEKEWEVMAQGKNKNPHGFKQLRRQENRKINEKNRPDWQLGERANCKMKKDSIRLAELIKMSHEHYTKLTLVRHLDSRCTYPPNEHNVYDTIGNVAEMVQEEGIAKGGSWFHTLEESAIKERQTYTKPTAWLGFRCVATVKLTPKEKVGKAK